ncbi:PLAC8 family protein [Phytophthora cinnamomi]|uniref:PLAC8 family protein n=1 Tax=Phytophthora cinnamomi TaxID=4785 RepID=UPI00355A859C|nr:PLAC8 family protein [Phytophthora cinnamomi]
MADTNQVYTIQVEEPEAKGFSNIKVGKWDAPFCGCFTHMVPNCLMVIFCPCFSLSQVLSRLGMMSFGAALAITIMLGVLVACTGGLGHIVFALWIWTARLKTRERFQIPGSCCEDYLAACCCGCCTLAQIATHIKSYKPGSCAFGPQDTLPAYIRI